MKNNHFTWQFVSMRCASNVRIIQSCSIHKKQTGDKKKMKIVRNFGVLIVLFCMIFLCPATISHAKSIGFVKKSGKYYYYQREKKVTGLKKIKGKYYYFEKNGAMASGYKKLSGVLYYFKEKSGKAPAITDSTRKYKGTTYYFSSEGKGFISVNNKKGNRAVAKIFDECKLKNSMNKKKKLEILYRQVMERSSYLGIGEPDLTSSWVNACAFEMVKWSSGNCYSYASIIFLLAKAEGYSAKIYVGKCNRNSSDATEHSWVVVEDKYLLDGIFEDLDYHENGALKFFFQTYDQIKSGAGYEYFPDSVAN